MLARAFLVWVCLAGLASAGTASATFSLSTDMTVTTITPTHGGKPVTNTTTTRNARFACSSGTLLSVRWDGANFDMTCAPVPSNRHGQRASS